MPDKILTEFIDPQWINKLKDKHITNEKLAEIIGMESTVAVSNLLNQKNNPSTHYRDVISKEFNITFDYIKIKDLILTISHISDRKISTNCKRVLFLLLLFEGKAPGAEIEVEELKKEGKTYGYKDKEIDEAIEKLVNKGLVEHKKDKVNLIFKGFRKLYDDESKEKKKNNKKK